MSLVQFLTWLTTSGGCSAALSFVAERVPRFQALTSEQKSYVHLGGSLAIALASYAVLTYVPQPALDQITPWFLLAAGVFGTWITNQLAHKADPAA